MKTKPKPQPYGGNKKLLKETKAWTPEQGVQGGKKPPPKAPPKVYGGKQAAPAPAKPAPPKSAPQPYGGNKKLLDQTKAWTPPARPPIISNLVRPGPPPAPIDWASRTNVAAQGPKRPGGTGPGWVEGWGTKKRLMNENEPNDTRYAVRSNEGPQFGLTEKYSMATGEGGRGYLSKLNTKPLDAAPPAEPAAPSGYLSTLNTGVPEGTLPRPANPQFTLPKSIQQSPYAPVPKSGAVVSNIISNLGKMQDHTTREALDTIAFDTSEDIRVAEKNPLSPGEVAFIASATGIGAYALSKLLGAAGAMTGPAAPVLGPAGYLAGGYFGGQLGNNLATWAVGQDWNDLDMEPSWSYWPNQVEAAEREAQKTGVPVDPNVYRTGGIGSDFVPGAIHGFQNWLYGTPLAETRGDYRGSGATPIVGAAVPGAGAGAVPPVKRLPYTPVEFPSGSPGSQVPESYTDTFNSYFMGRPGPMAAAPKPPAAAAPAATPFLPPAAAAAAAAAAPAAPAPEPGGGGDSGDGMSEFEQLAQLMEIGKYARQPDNTRENELYAMLQESQNQMQALQQQYIEALIKQLNTQPQMGIPAPVSPGAPAAAAGNMYSLMGIPRVAATGSNLQFSNAGLGYLNSIDPSLLQALMQYLKAMNYTGQGQMGSFGEMNYARQGGLGSLLQSDASFENPLAYAGLTPQMREPAEAGLRSLFAQMGLMG